jgi:ABC-2 type transport system permease protein
MSSVLLSLSFLTFAGVGVLIGVASSTTNLCILVSQLLYIPSILLGGIMVPSSAMPAVFRKIGLLLPASHVMRLFDSLAYGRGPLPAGSLAVLGASIGLSFLLAGRLFQWDARSAQPARQAWMALLAAVPYLAAALLG